MSFLFLSFSLFNFISAQVSFFEKPIDNRFYCRDVASNEAVVPVSGVVDYPGVEKLALIAFKDGVVFAGVTQQLSYNANGQAPFDMSITIEAGLHDYAFYLYAEKSGVRRQIFASKNIVSGDAYIIDGQSNAVATDYHFEGLANEHQSPWIRTYGTASLDASDVQSNKEWSMAGGLSLHGKSSVGAWGLRCAYLLMNEFQMPIALLNGAVGGTTIQQHLRDTNNPDNLNTIYGRLLYRAIKSGISSKARAILWHQGESNGAEDPQVYLANWNILRSAWSEDYPNANRVFVFQIRDGCGVDGRIAIRELQRRFPDMYDDITLVPTTAINEHDGCHFFYQGYKTMGTWMATAVAKEVYGKSVLPNMLPPRVKEARFVNNNRKFIELSFHNSNQSLVLDSNIESRFSLGSGSNQVIVNASTVPGKILLELSAETSSTAISFVGNSGSGPWIKNEFGVGAFTFKVPILP